MRSGLGNTEGKEKDQGKVKEGRYDGRGWGRVKVRSRRGGSRKRQGRINNSNRLRTEIIA